MTQEREYVLGTHDEEVERLGVQHRLWRARMLDAWRRAGIRAGQTVLDIGAGPGYAALDLAEIVGSSGRVVALERSRRFLAVLAARARARGLTQLEGVEADVVSSDFGVTGADAAWCRWVLSFVNDPRAVVRRIRAALRPGGIAVFHEYVDYGGWRLLPKLPALELFVARVMDSWRADGGEPDVGRDLPTYLIEQGFMLASTQLHTEAVAPEDPLWRWPAVFVETGWARLVALGRMTQAEADELLTAFASAARLPHARIILPSVLEVVARAPA